MSSTTRRRSERRYALERELAPHVDPAWTEAVLLELRIQGVSGTHVGEAIREVESHCAESGQSADEAFGDPVGYARSLGLPHSPAQSSAATVRAVLPTLVQLAGMFLVLWTVPALAAGDAVTITLGHVLAVVVLVAVNVALARWPEPVLRAVVRRPVLAALAIGGGITAIVVPLLLLQAGLFSVPAAAAGCLGLVLLAVGVAVELSKGRRAESQDPVLWPLQDEESAERRRHESRRVGLLGVLLVPAWTVVVGALLWWITSAA
ncbi:hypothetical protein [Oerskovia flava]|uniref:hypothetical protein n=1 Tax=Oerskovia flava TaxID=2986422 RepID=UPI00223F5CC0|nr:hypothetical protein [Oerskovia sp. JB1-3-2]